MSSARYYFVDGRLVFGVPAGDVVLDEHFAVEQLPDVMPAPAPVQGYYFARAWR